MAVTPVEETWRLTEHTSLLMGEMPVQGHSTSLHMQRIHAYGSFHTAPALELTKTIFKEPKL